jgi:hypothetical protein
MALGPTLTFDKSFLQSINPDESMWLDHFFSCNITPLFFIETLADIEKEVHKGRTPEEIVGSLAYKTPDSQSQVNPFHLSLLESELIGRKQFGMDGRIFKAGGQVVALKDRHGLVYRMSPEEEAFHRWQRHEFPDLERQIAKAWRKSVTGLDHTQTYASFGKFYDRIPKPKDFSDVKRIADSLIDHGESEHSFKFGMSILGIPPNAQNHILHEWINAGKPALQGYAPYFRHLYAVDLFFYLSIAADLISRVRPAGKADNMVDVAYLYYLPFCNIFTSSDALHERIVPPFLRGDQSFVNGSELKADLRKLDEHYSALPEEIKVQPAYAFAPDPPLDSSFLTTRLWDKHRPDWRKQKAEHQELSPDLQKALLELVKKFADQSEPRHPGDPGPRSIEDIEYIHDQRQIMGRKGKWLRVPPVA